MKVVLDIPADYYGAVKGMLNVLLPELEICRREEIVDPEVEINSQLIISGGIKVKTELKGMQNLQDQQRDEEILRGIYTEKDLRRRKKSLLKLSIYQLLCDYLDQKMSPWGILVGVRPTKIGQFLLDKGIGYEQIDWILNHAYGVAEEKRQLLLAVVNKERPYLLTKREAKQTISLYVGIPFCPTRCDYCSFASYPLSEHSEYLANFRQALHYEIKELGAKVKQLNLAVDTVYVGGGTPTVLTADQLNHLFEWLEDYFPLTDLREFTVEAGRPDTITQPKLEVLKQAGVERISVNPQTMNQATLDKIGRDHTVKEVREAVKLARKVGFKNINMDLIVGLPDEDRREIAHTAREIKKLAPASLTIHTLTIKRAANLNREEFSLPTPTEVKQGLVRLKELAANLGLEPYYMYRQKGSLGNFENVGYAQPGLESVYNILMMEERTTIIGVGGGAVSKFVTPENWSLDRKSNPKFPAQYIKEINSRVKTRVAKLTSIFK